MTFKTPTFVLAIAVAVGVTAGFNFTQANAPVEQVVELNDNVGNGEQYAYEITDMEWVNDEVEVHGVPLNKESSGNKGIFLYAPEIPFQVEEGDRIVVVWGEEEDEFASIERAYQAEDGSWVGESFYNN